MKREERQKGGKEKTVQGSHVGDFQIILILKLFVLKNLRSGCL